MCGEESIDVTNRLTSMSQQALSMKKTIRSSISSFDIIGYGLKGWNFFSFFSSHVCIVLVVLFALVVSLLHLKLAITILVLASFC